MKAEGRSRLPPRADPAGRTAANSVSPWLVFKGSDQEKAAIGIQQLMETQEGQ